MIKKHLRLILYVTSAYIKQKGVSLAGTQPKPVRMTSSDKLNLERFGCTFRNGAFCIDWKGKHGSQVANAGIFSCLGRVDTNSGPIVLLAFEISIVRPLPTYYYFPFNLNNPVHRRYLSRLTKQGEIEFRFLTKRKIYTR